MRSLGWLVDRSGERASLIMWTKSSQFRKTEQYASLWVSEGSENSNPMGCYMSRPEVVLLEQGNKMNFSKEEGAPDRICLSYTHDKDFKK